MAKGSKTSKTKGVSKSSAPAPTTAAAAASAASAAATAAAAAARLLPAVGTRPATRSSPALEPDPQTAEPRTIGDLANAGSQPRTADMPQLDSPSTGTQSGGLSQLAVDYAQARQELTDAQNQLQQLQLAAATSDSSRRPGAPTPPRPAEVLPYVPPAPPPPAFRYGMFSGTQGVAEIFAAMSVAYSAMRIPSVLATPVHAFPTPAGASAALIYQQTAPHHHYMYNFFDLKLRPLPTTWSVFSEALVTAVRQQQSVFGVYAVQELETLLRCFGTDVDELRQDARLVNFSRPIDACVISAVTQALRDASPLSIFAAVEAELARLRVAIYDAQPVQPYADRGGRGRGAGDHHPAPSGGASGSTPLALERCTVVEHTPQNGFIRKGVRGPDGRYAAGTRCFKCGSLAHRVDACTALAGVIEKWVQNAEPAQ